MPPDRTYPSRIDAWLVAVVFAAAALPLGVGLWLLVLGQYRGLLLLLSWGGVMTLMIGALSVPLRYTLMSDRLHVQSGVLAWDIAYATLRRVAPSRNPLSAPAWSLRRVRLDSADGSCILVSPDDAESFIEQLAVRCPHLQRHGSTLDAHSPTP